MAETTEPENRKSLNRDLHEQASLTRPIVARGVPGAGADLLADDALRGQQSVPTVPESSHCTPQHPPRVSSSSQQNSYAKGAAGERLVAEALNWLPGNQFWVLHDQPWPGRPQANIDHIVVGQTGIFVIDAKNWSGKIKAERISDDAAVGEGAGTSTPPAESFVLTQNGQDRSSAISGVVEQMKAVQMIAQRLPFADAQQLRVSPVIAFIDNAEIQSPSFPTPFEANGATLVSTSALASFIGSSPVVIAQSEVGHVAYELEEALRKNRIYVRAINRRAYFDQRLERQQSNTFATPNRFAFEVAAKKISKPKPQPADDWFTATPPTPARRKRLRPWARLRSSRRSIKPLGKSQPVGRNCSGSQPPSGNELVDIFILVAVVCSVVGLIAATPLLSDLVYWLQDLVGR